MNLPPIFATVATFLLLSLLFALFMTSSKNSKNKGCLSTILFVVLCGVFIVISGKNNIVNTLNKSELRIFVVNTNIFVLSFVIFALIFFVEDLPQKIHKGIKNIDIITQPIIFIMGLALLLLIYLEGHGLALAASGSLGIMLGMLSGSILRKIVKD